MLVQDEFQELVDFVCVFLFIPLKKKRDCNKSHKWQTNENELYHSMAEHPHLYIQNAEIMAFVFD